MGADAKPTLFMMPAGLKSSGRIFALCSAAGCYQTYGPFSTDAEAKSSPALCPRCWGLKNDLLNFSEEADYENR